MYGNLKFIYDETPLWNEKKVKDKKEQKLTAYVRFDQLYGDGKRKQIKIDQIKQEKKLEQMLQEIELEDSKMGISTVSKKLTASRRPDQFYEYNKQWAMKINEKKQQQRTEHFNQAINQQIESQQKSQQRAFFQETMLNNYNGPISGWQQRFENYLNTKIKLQEVGEQQNTFQPKINENSKKMTSFRDSTPIEERLLKYGEELKMKQEIIRQQMDILSQESDEFGQKKPSINKNYVYGESDGSKVHDKLYEYAKVYEQKIQELKSEAQNQFNFKPALNQMSEQLKEKVQQKRKPLYEPKKKESLEEKKPSKQFNVQNFEQFLERNYTQFERKLERLQQRDDQVQAKELEECSFQPQINKKSLTKSVIDQEKTLYEREQEKLKKKQEQLQQLHEQITQEDQKNCTFKPQKTFNIIEERKQIQEQNKKLQEKKKSVPAIKYPKVRSKTLVTDKFKNGQNLSEQELNNSSDENLKRNHGSNQSDEDEKDKFQKAFQDRYQNANNYQLSKSVNFQSIPQNQSVQAEKNAKRKQRSPLKRQSPSPKTTFKLNSSSKKGNNELNQSKNDSDQKNNQSFLNNLLNSQINKGNFNLESLLNQSIQNWGEHYNLSPSKLSKKKILDEFNQIEKEIQTIVKEVDQIKEKDDNDKSINSSTFPKLSNFKNYSQGNNEGFDSKHSQFHPQIIIEDHNNEA
ncbi:hypothetical protein ABPG74_009301 [Tetrahymena malaccensis]